MSYYVDTSALVKLVVAEAESGALQAWLAEAPRNPVACDLVRTELTRAVRRVAPERVTRVRDVLRGLTLTQLPPLLFDHAGRLDPVDLRTLDALHLASALDLGDDLEGIVSYDDRLSAAATQAGIAVISPGR